MANTYEIWTEPLSESAAGRPIEVASTTATAATALHVMTVADAIDCVWIYATNKTAAAVALSLVLNPADDTDAGDVADAEVPFSVPAGGTILLLDGARLRVGAAAYTVGAYAGSSNDVTITGYMVRKIYSEVTA